MPILTPLGFAPENIPRELRDQPRWACYKLEPNPDGGKDKKVPNNPSTGRHAKINEPATFGTFDAALAGVTSGRFDGINYAFGYDTFVGIDLDTVVHPETGEFLDADAAEIVRRFSEAGAYVERSPSSAGIRIICKGLLPGFGKGRTGFNHFEVYGKGPKGLHFLSLTGNAINPVETVPFCVDLCLEFSREYIQRPETLPRPIEVVGESPELSDEEIIRLVRGAKNGVEFSTLFDNGSTGDHSSDDLRLCSMLGFYTQNPDQIDQIFRESALYRAKWDRADYRESTIRKALEGLTATYQRRGPEIRYGTTESEAARRLVESDEGSSFRVLRQARRPDVYRYDGGVWRIDHHRAALLNAVRGVAKQLRTEMVEEANAQRRDKLYSLAKKLETRRGLDDVTTLATYMLAEFDPHLSDQQDGLLLVANGQLILATGELIPHDPLNQWTRQSFIVFDPRAKCPTFTKLIYEFCCGDEALARFLQLWFGYCCSGYTVEHKAAIFFGFGQNGKSVLLETIKHILSQFATTTPTDTLLQRRSDQTNDIAALEGVRFVSAIETDEGQALAEGRVKSLTGGDEIVCRKLFEEFRTFTPKFKLNLATNAKPRVSGTDNGIWRRLLLIPCRAEVSNPDRQLFEKLKAEASGILNWLVEGFRAWQAEGLVIPDCIKQATADYRQESDIVGRFLEDNPPPFDPVKSSIIYKQFALWADEQGHKAFSQMRFSQKLTEKGFSISKRQDGNYIRRPK
ncbi:phage/plasmid primase, P4 family [Methylomonas sp. 2BW1-5-20]|uniref:phage/plasmid primase, P4 family n=1 Tax=Methylomonas sp. 2BW1-5-20 TaxID=3376686 RepID=UPI004052D38B